MGNPDLALPASGRGRAHPILLNRRAATRPTITGVERWTAEIIPRLYALGPSRYEVVAPRPRLRRRSLAQAWEQAVLPAQAVQRGASVIFSPANLAPLLWPRNVIVVHDAAVLREAEAYSRAYQLWHRHLGLAAARRALTVITVSEFSRRELIEAAGLDPTRLEVVAGGVSEAFGPGARADAPAVAARLQLRRPYVLTIATDDQRKNVSALTEAARRLNEAGIDLVRAGDTRSYFAASGENPIRSLGYVDDGDLPGLYGGAEAFVLPSRYEGFGLTCIEAMACGAPVVAADRAALPETCGDAALLVDPDDPRALAEAVLRAATDPTIRAGLIERGAQRATLFTWDRAAGMTHALLTAAASA